jgi:signal transduction histidine kinase
MTHLLLRSGVSDDQALRLDKIETAGQHLLEILNAVLDLSKIEAGKLSLERTRVAVNGVVHNVVSMLHDRAVAKALVISEEVQQGLARCWVTRPACSRPCSILAAMRSSSPGKGRVCFRTG